MELRHKYDLSILLKCLKMPRSSFYYYVKQIGRVDKYQEVKKMIQDFYHSHKGRVGYRRMKLLLANNGYIINHKTVFRLMGILKIRSIIRTKKYNSYKGEQGRIAPNILNRNFKAERPNEKWATDVTEFKVSGRKLYLSPVIDLYNQEIISYELSESPNFKSILNMLEKAFKNGLC